MDKCFNGISCHIYDRPKQRHNVKGIRPQRSGVDLICECGRLLQLELWKMKELYELNILMTTYEKTNHLS